MSNKIERCQCKNITNNKLCHNKSTNIMILNNKRICNFHYWYYHNIYGIIIQKYYKGYKQRKLIKNIYINLPIDLQKHIIYFIRQDYYYKRYKKTINKIIEPKIHTLLSKLSDIWYSDENNYNDNIFAIYIYNNIKYIITTYILFEKYYTVLNKITIHKMYIHYINILKIYYLYNNVPLEIETMYFKIAHIFDSIEI